MARGGFRYTESTRKYTYLITGAVYRVVCFRIDGDLRHREWVKEVWVPKMEAADFYDQYHLKRIDDLFYMVSCMRGAAEKPEDMETWNESLRQGEAK